MANLCVVKEIIRKLFVSSATFRAVSEFHGRELSDKQTVTEGKTKLLFRGEWQINKRRENCAQQRKALLRAFG
jgi:hypothetical protein